MLILARLRHKQKLVMKKRRKRHFAGLQIIWPAELRANEKAVCLFVNHPQKGFTEQGDALIYVGPPQTEVMPYSPCVYGA
jgi:hypothetical protein